MMRRRTNPLLYSLLAACLLLAHLPPALAHVISGSADGNDGFIIQSGPLDGPNLSSAVSSAGSAQKTIRVATSQSVAASLTIPKNVTLEFTDTGVISVASGQTLTLQGAVLAPPRQIFSGAGLVRFTGNKSVNEVSPEWWGAAGDGTTDDTGAVQAAIDSVGGLIDATVQLRGRVYLIAGALRDTRASNSQLVLPKVTSSNQMMSLRIRGAAPASTMAVGQAGTILRSTLASGSGAVLGVRTNVPFAGVTGITFLSLHLEDLTVQTVDNPTISGIDLSYVPNLTLRNVKLLTGSDTTITQPTTSTSYGIKLTLDTVGDMIRVNNVQTSGFYTGVRVGELSKIDDLVVNYAIYPVEISGPNNHRIDINRLTLTECQKGIRFTGGISYVNIKLTVEHDNAVAAWYNNTEDVSDPSNYGRGIIEWHTVLQNVGVDHTFNVTGGAYLDFPELGIGPHPKGLAALGYTNRWGDQAGEAAGQYYRRDGRVFLQGCISSGTVGAGTPVVTLPVGYRPTSTRYMISAAAGSTVAHLQVTSAGALAVRSGSNTSICLDGVSWAVTDQ
ncbi:MAG TPA: hypothetical protein VFZ44_07720 [Pyrinomonadaceae bacterium]